MIRSATPEDCDAILAIYAPYVKNTRYSFEYVAPTREEFLARMLTIMRRYPFLVWEEEGRILGYAYADVLFTRAAYAWDAETSIYLAPEARCRGIGRRLYACLEALLTQDGYRNLYAIITQENVPSIRFHERCGYSYMGCLPETGFKLGAWAGVVFYGKMLQPLGLPDEPPRPFREDETAREIYREYSRSEG